MMYMKKSNKGDVHMGLQGNLVVVGQCLIANLRSAHSSEDIDFINKHDVLKK